MDVRVEVLLLSIWILLLSVGFFVWPWFFRPRFRMESKVFDLSRWGLIIVSTISTLIAAASLGLASSDGLFPARIVTSVRAYQLPEIDKWLRGLTAALAGGVLTVISCCEVCLSSSPLLVPMSRSDWGSRTGNSHVSKRCATERSCAGPFESPTPLAGFPQNTDHGPSL
jgi:hypothetical protein